MQATPKVTAPARQGAQPSSPVADEGLPSFSIVVPTFNRPQSLARLLKGLARLDYPCSLMEVVVVDDGGRLQTSRMLTDPVPPFNVRLLTQDHAGPAAARNQGALEAKGTLLAFIDDDCVPHRLWLRHLADGLARHPGSACGGRVVNAVTGNLFSEASQMVVDCLYQHLNIPEGEAGFLASNNLAMARRDFVDVGGFDPAFRVAGGEDRHFCRQWLKSGRRLCYYPEAVVQHYHRLVLRGFLGQHLRYGRGSRILQLKDSAGRSGSAGFFTPHFYWRMVTQGLRRQPGWSGLQLTACLLVAQAATASGYLAQALCRSSAPGGRESSTSQTNQPVQG